jgi:hypothetical protein
MHPLDGDVLLVVLLNIGVSILSSASLVDALS